MNCENGLCEVPNYCKPACMDGKTCADKFAMKCTMPNTCSDGCAAPSVVPQAGCPQNVDGKCVDATGNFKDYVRTTYEQDVPVNAEKMVMQSQPEKPLEKMTE